MYLPSVSAPLLILELQVWHTSQPMRYANAVSAERWALVAERSRLSRHWSTNSWGSGRSGSEWHRQSPMALSSIPRVQHPADRGRSTADLLDVGSANGSAAGVIGHVSTNSAFRCPPAT